MFRSAQLGRHHVSHWANPSVAQTTSTSLFGSLCNNELFHHQTRLKHRFRNERDKAKMKNNQGARDRFIFMHDGSVLRGPIAFKRNRIHQSMKKRQAKKNQLFELKGRYVKRAKILVPHFKKQYCRRWEMKSLPLWYREHWQNLEIKTETPDVFKRAIKEPHKLEKIRNADPRYHTKAYKI